MTSLSGIPENFILEFKKLKDEVRELQDQVRRTGSGDLGDEVIETVHVQGEAVTSPKIAPDNVNETHILVPDIGTINPDLGEITAGTLTGAVHRTSASDPKVQMDTTGVFATDSLGVETIHINTDGSITSGRQSFRASEFSTASTVYVAIPSTDVTIPINANGFFSIYVEAEMKTSSAVSAFLSIDEISSKDGLSGGTLPSGFTELFEETNTSYQFQTVKYWLAFRATSASGDRTFRAVLKATSPDTAFARNIRIFVKTT